MIVKCFYYYQSRESQRREVKRGYEVIREESYFKKYCLNGCDGFNEKCSSYMVVSQSGKTIINRGEKK